MELALLGHGFRYECENLCRLFFPYSPVRVVEGDPLAGGAGVLTEIAETDGGWQYTVKAVWEGRAAAHSETHAALEEYSLTDLLYRTLRELTGITPAWGMLTGIHPVKLLRQSCTELGDEAGMEKFRSRCHVSSEKADLAYRTLRAQRPVVSAMRPRDFCLYVGIPFCPSRCSYCSFVSQSVAQAKKLMEPYFALLLEEIARTAEITATLGLTLSGVYIGGGTPTTLTAEQLSVLCGAIRQRFDFSRCTEFTVEAGRPDTIDLEKLTALRAAGVTRVSINPQSLSDEVLRAIGRRHTAQAVLDAFALARQAGFTQINCDLIVGLPRDTLAGFRHSLDGVIALGAENVTVHSLALKRSANLLTEGGDLSLHARREEVSAMMEYSITRLTETGYQPYYLYRQSRTAGNLENTGWAKPGTVCAYNIHSTDEELTVIACGAGGVTKLKDPSGDTLTRIFNFKYPYEYISRHEELLARKQGIAAFYRDVCKL